MDTTERDFWIALGLWGATASTVLGTGLYGLIEAHYWPGGFFTASGLGALVFIAWHLKGKRLRLEHALIGALILTWLFFGYDILDRRQVPAIYADFQTTYQDHALELGKPLAQATITDAYQAVHEHALIIWISSHLLFYVLPSGQQKQQVILQRDPTWSNDSRFSDEHKARLLFHPPTNLYPPFAGVASHWSSDPDRWQWIGWRVWHCMYLSPNAHYQQFEKGLLIGLFRETQQGANAGQTFGILNNGTWFSELNSSTKAPSCIDPARK